MNLQALKRVSGFLLLTIILLSVNNCSAISPKKIEALREWHGTKKDCIDFLNSPMAQAERWEVLAIGE
jgi:hypothetical protein